MISIKESQESLSPDIELCVHMLTFVALWKMKKYSESVTHVEFAAGILNKIISGFLDTNMSNASSQNLYGLIVMSLSALKIKINKDLKSGIKICEDFLSEINSKSISYTLLKEYLQRISGKSLPESDWLIGSLYQKVLFVSTFIPLISPNTPLIHSSELESDQERPSYTEEKKSEVSYKIPSQDRLDSSRVSRKATRSTPRPHYKNRPWWETNKAISKAISPKNIARDHQQFKSEPRQPRKGSMLPTRTKFSPSIIPPILSKLSSDESFKPDTNRPKEPPDANKPLKSHEDVMMLEFNPKYDQESGECLVQLIPLSMFKANSHIKERPLTNFHICRPVF
jgi:hypothetical protein